MTLAGAADTEGAQGAILNRLPHGRIDRHLHPDKPTLLTQVDAEGLLDIFGKDDGIHDLPHRLPHMHRLPGAVVHERVVDGILQLVRRHHVFLEVG